MAKEKIDLRERPELAAAYQRGEELKKIILESEGGTLTTEETAQNLGITPRTVDIRRRLGKILALSVGKRRYAYPVWQFTPTGMLPGIRECLEEFSITDPWTKAAFFLGENIGLDGKRPLDELRNGNIKAVRRAAWAMGKQGAL